MDVRTEEVYRLFLEQPALGMDEIIERLGRPESEVKAALDDLADLCLLLYDRASGVFHPTDPGVSLPSLVSRREAELERQQQQIETVRAAVADLAEQYGTRGAYRYEAVERIVGLDAVRTRLEELALSAKRECLSLLPGGAQAPDTMSASKPLDQRALERGVRIRSIYQDSYRNDPATLQYVNWLGSLGGDTRTVPSLPMLLVVVDRETALLPIDPEDGRAGALEVRAAGVISALCLLFDMLWASGTQLGMPPSKDRHQLTPQERELLHMLASGQTDAHASRRLGVSLRTVRRINAELMLRLEARSRFEAGVEASRRGWV
ncbi:helix-turn-helix transcriptional regulator [Streptomyces sp. NBC_00388]|uniref:helix-turn-helix transcriptional regulator n=1 Tax=Streptomyces sp. NBC_00388 TaxID=2975735 RepID=UPI002E23AAEE